jgi:5'-methylthioadenosine phosphorylase
MQAALPTIETAVIGGSGLYNMPELTDITQIEVETPYGNPSAAIVCGQLQGKPIAFLPRHGIGHVYTPSTVPYRANIFALKRLGVRQIIAVNACGSLREDYQPGDIVIPDQLIDLTRGTRERTFFDTGLVGHVSVADPFCGALGISVAQAVRDAGGTVHEGGVYVTVEGTRFSTRGESNLYRQWGCSIIGMTTSPEAFLAREAEMCYTTMSHVTDFDVWHTSETPVTVEMVMRTMAQNLSIAKQAILNLIATFDSHRDCTCHTALDNTIMTDPRYRSQSMLEKLHPLLDRLNSRTS